MFTATDIIAALNAGASEEQARHLSRFFKTGPGEYGCGDRFLGLRTPQVDAVVKEVRLRVCFDEIEKLIYSEWHEARACGLALLQEEMRAARLKKRGPETERARRRQEIADFYLKHARQSNNWDLVDCVCPHVLGEYLLHPKADGSMPDRKILDRLAESDNLWENRIAIVSTLQLIRAGQFDDALRICTRLLGHPHDLIHKATGWILREVGKRDLTLLCDYLEAHYAEMSRTALRYAIEKMTPARRKEWLARPRLVDKKIHSELSHTGKNS